MGFVQRIVGNGWIYTGAGSCGACEEREYGKEIKVVGGGSQGMDLSVKR